MVNINIDDEVHKEWVEFYNKHSKVEYPNLKNFTARKLREIIKNAT